MNCPACGADNREGARFCRECGTQVLEAEAGPVHQAEETPAGEQLGDVVSRDPTPDAPQSDPEGIQLEEEQGAASSEAKPEDAPVEEADTGDQKAEAEPPDAAGDIGVEPEQAEEGDDELSPAGQPEEQDVPATFKDDQEDYEPLDEDEDEDLLTFWRDEVEPMTPVEQGTVLEDRYAIEEALDLQADEILYKGLDLWRCWQCGYEENDPEGAFCARCGVLMGHRPEVRLLEVPGPDVQPTGDWVVVKRLRHDSRHFLVVVEPEPEPPPEAEVLPVSPCLRLLMGQRSDPGQIRELDEDSMFALTMAPTYESRTGPALGLYSIADGMGGHAGGEVASRMALQVMVERVLSTVFLPEIAGELVLEEDILALLRQATLAANDEVYLTRQKRETDMGTTLTTILIRDSRLFLAHVGDSRAYRWNADGLEQLTTDHSVVASMIVEGKAEPEELFTHPHRSIIYRCIGDKPVVEVETDLLPVSPGDRFIVCSDGLWEMIRDEGIEDVMLQEADPQVACDLLVRRANAAGGDDNISVIVVQVDAVSDLEE
jgi:serine/threonine protein phosphatase PrpC